METKEGEVKCSTSEEECAGILNIVAINFTKVNQDGTEVLKEALEVNLWKGCMPKSKFTAEHGAEENDFDQDRICYKSEVEGIDLSNEVATELLDKFKVIILIRHFDPSTQFVAKLSHLLFCT